MTENEFTRTKDLLIFDRAFWLAVPVYAVLFVAATNVFGGTAPQTDAGIAWKLNSSANLTFGISKIFALAHAKPATNFSLDEAKNILASCAPVENVVPNVKNSVTISDGPFTLQGTTTTAFGANFTNQFSLSWNAIRLSSQSRVTGEVVTNKALLREGSQIIHPPIVSP
jgi:hypothetical protein